MPAPVPRQKVTLSPAVFAADHHVGGRTERCLILLFGRGSQLLHLIQATAADDADCRRWFFHCQPDLSERSTSWKADNLSVAKPDGACIISPANAQVFHQDLRLSHE